MSRSGIEISEALDLDFEKLKKIAIDVVPVVVQDVDSLAVLILGYVNQAALSASLATRKVTLYSTSRNEIWVKGTSSGDFLDLVEVRVNCEQNSLLFLARPRTGQACHAAKSDGAKYRSCFYRRVDANRLTICEK